MVQAQRVISGDPVVTDMHARIAVIGRRQEELAQVVENLGGSSAGFGQLRAYVEQVAEVVSDVAREVAAHDVTMLEDRLDKVAEVAGDAGKLRDEVGRLRGEVHGVAELIGEPAGRPGTQKAVWWPDLPEGPERVEAMQCLGTWVDEVLRARHPEAYHELGTCWFLHPDILDELTALHAAWLWAYREKASPGTAAIEWHDRWLPGAMARCSAAMKMRGCKARHEKESLTTAAFLDRQEFKNFVRRGPELAPPVAEPSPPWDPIAEPAPPPGAFGGFGD